LKLNGTHHILVYADDVNIVVGSVGTTKKNTDPLVVVSKKTGREVNDDKTKYMIISQNQNARRSHNLKIHKYISVEMWKISNIWEQP
jgi:galactitol-specific phosphotransferase system IIB component